MSHKPWSVVLSCIWGCLLIHYVTCPNSFLEILDMLSYVMYTSMFDILTTIKAFYSYMSEYVPILVWNVLKLPHLLQLFIPKFEYLPFSVKYATQLLWKTSSLHYIVFKMSTNVDFASLLGVCNVLSPMVYSRWQQTWRLQESTKTTSLCMCVHG